METFTSSTRVYKFDEFVFDMFKANHLRRETPSSPLRLCRTSTMILEMMVLIILACGLMTKLVLNFCEPEFDFTEISAICEAGSVFVMTVGRGISLCVNHTSIDHMLRVLEQLFPATGDEQNKYHLESYAKRIIFRNKGMQVLITWSCITYMAIPFVQSMFGVIFSGEAYEFQYPFISWYPFNENRWICYPFIYGFHLLAGISSAIFYFYEEFIFTSCVLQLCMHYDHLCELLSAVDAKRVTNVGDSLGVHIRYQYVLEGLQDDINDSFSSSTFFGFTVIKITICMFFFSTVSGHGLLEDLPLFSCVMTLVVPVYLRCNAGTNLANASENVLGAIYNHNWYEGSVKYQKAIVTMMIRANKSKTLRASQLRQICMEYFKEIMVDTYQVFMFFFNSSH